MPPHHIRLFTTPPLTIPTPSNPPLSPPPPTRKPRLSSHPRKPRTLPAPTPPPAPAPPEPEPLRESFLLQFPPADPLQLALVDTLISTEWIQRRLRRVEAQLWNYQVE